jgi:CheY-like chemotaxis protein
VPLPSTTSLPGFRILIAEDNPINQKVAGLLLRRAGFEVDLVADGQQALEAHGSQPYDLILMDLQMPNVDGFEATRQIRRSQLKQPIIVAVSADVVDDVRARCLKEGMDDYLSKPFTRDQLLAVVRSAQERLAAADTIRRAS